jgi:hypothetical protein
VGVVNEEEGRSISGKVREKDDPGENPYDDRSGMKIDNSLDEHWRKTSMVFAQPSRAEEMMSTTTKFSTRHTHVIKATRNSVRLWFPTTSLVLVPDLELLLIGLLAGLVSEDCTRRISCHEPSEKNTMPLPLLS